MNPLGKRFAEIIPTTGRTLVDSTEYEIKTTSGRPTGNKVRTELHLLNDGRNGALFHDVYQHADGRREEAWRYEAGGVHQSYRDLNGDGRVDFVHQWNPHDAEHPTGRSFVDADHDGFVDHKSGTRRWINSLGEERTYGVNETTNDSLEVERTITKVGDVEMAGALPKYVLWK